MKRGQQGAFHGADIAQVLAKMPIGPKWQWMMSYAGVFSKTRDGKACRD